MKTLVDTFCKERDGETKRLPSLFRSVLLSLRPSFAPSLRLSVSLSLFLPVFLAACVKVGPPEPPFKREPLIVNNLSVEQRGGHLILSIPFRRTPKTQMQRIDVYRLLEPLDAPMGVPEETFSERA